jgi:phosphoribosylpyrophosphate synthetase
VAGREVVVVQTTRQDPHTAVEKRQSVSALLAEALMLFKSAVEQGATDVKLVLPYMPSGRSDKNDQKGVGAYAGLVARWVDAIVDEGRKLAEARGKRLEFNPRVVMVEPHDVHNPVFFRTPVDVISGAEVLVGKAIKDLGREDMVLVRPDAGAQKRTAAVGKAYDLPVVDGEKTRAGNDDKADVKKLAKPEDVRGKVCVVTDDEIATGGTMQQTVSLLAFERLNKPGDKDDGKILNEDGKLLEEAGGTPKRLAKEVHVAISHTNMPTDPEARLLAIRKLKDAGATRLYVLDTQPINKLPPDLEGFVKVVSAAESIADVLGNLKVSGA